MMWISGDQYFLNNKEFSKFVLARELKQNRVSETKIVC